VDPEVRFVPADTDPLLPVAARQDGGADPSGGPQWLGYAEIGLVLLLAFGAVIVLDHRFRLLHRRTRHHIPAERGGDN